MQVTHSTYGVGIVSRDDLYNDPSKMIDFTPNNRRETLNYPIKVGKSALSDQGNYVPRKYKPDLIMDHISYAATIASKYYRVDDEWTDVYSVAVEGLIEAASKYDPSKNDSFIGYAKPRITGAVLNYKNPVRNGTMNTFSNLPAELFENTSTTNDNKVHDELVHDCVTAMYSALDDMTKKQREVTLALYVRGDTMENVAKKMGVQKPTIQVHRDLALKKVRKKLNDVT
jgi:RNA polymerase sigma factor (sigma-70 family)